MTKTISCVICILLCCGLAFSTNAQKKLRNPDTDQYTTWVNHVSRLIVLTDTTNITYKATHATSYTDTTLPEVLTRLVLAGKLPAYSTYDSKYSYPVDLEKLKEELAPWQDTTVVRDPATGDFVPRSTTHYFNYSWMTKCRVQEEWRYNFATGITTIRVIGLGMMLGEYDTDGNYRGGYTRYWLKYDDVKDIIKQYELQHGGRPHLHNSIWNSYPAAEAGTEKIRKADRIKTVSRVVIIHDTNSYYRNTLQHQYWDTDPGDTLTNMAAKGKIQAYDTTGTKPVPASVIQAMAAHPKDTFTVEDPVTGEQISKVIERRSITENILKFKVLEEWAYSYDDDITTIRIAGIAPMADRYSDEGMYEGWKTLYYVRYEDAKGVFDNYAQQHPEANLYQEIWKSYFGEKSAD